MAEGCGPKRTRNYSSVACTGRRTALGNRCILRSSLVGTVKLLTRVSLRGLDAYGATTKRRRVHEDTTVQDTLVLFGCVEKGLDEQKCADIFGRYDMFIGCPHMRRGLPRHVCARTSSP